MKNLVVMITFSYLATFCGAQNKSEIRQENTPILTNTKWKCKIAEGCINFYEFKSDSNFIFHSCEMEDEYFGNYHFKGDTLILDQKGSIYDKNSSNQADRKLYKIKVNGDTLKHLSMSDWENGKWIKSEFKFDNKYLYIKIK